MGGTIYREVMDKAGHLPFVREYMSGVVDRAAFRQELEAHRGKLEALGVDGWRLDLLERFPADLWAGAEKMMQGLHAAGIAQSPTVDRQAFLDFEQNMERRFMHLPDRFTSIFPEEARIAYALSCAVRPKNIFVAGSYYGYLAVWLTLGISMGGQMVCSDVDATVCALAERNFSAMGEGGRVSVRCEDAEKLLKSGTEPIDVLVLDAYGSFEHPNARYHGKAIYAPLLLAALTRLHSDSLLLVHNADQGSQELSEFFAIIAGARVSLYLDTTDNLAVFQL